MSNPILDAMAVEYESGAHRSNAEAMRAALLWLADNVSDEMVAELRASLDRSPPNEWLPSIGYARAISAALCAAAGGGEK